MIRTKIIYAVVISVLIVGAGAAIYLMSDTPEFYVVSASFDRDTYGVSIVLSFTSNRKVVIETPDGSLLSVELIGDEADLWAVGHLSIQVPTKHELGPGSEVLEYRGTLYQTVESLVPLELPKSITFVVHMAKDYTTPPYTLFL